MSRRSRAKGSHRRARAETPLTAWWTLRRFFPSDSFKHDHDGSWHRATPVIILRDPASPRPQVAYVPIRVVASVIARDSTLLICERPIHKRQGGFWEFPGGKVEAEETDSEAVERELAEELGVAVVEVGSVEFSIHDPGSDFVIEFLPATIEGEPQALEHTALAWVTEDELLTMRLAPSDRRYAQFRFESAAGVRRR